MYVISWSCTGGIWVGKGFGGHAGVTTTSPDPSNHLLQVIAKFLAAGAVQQKVYSTVGHIQMVTNFRDQQRISKFRRGVWTREGCVNKSDITGKYQDYKQCRYQ